MTDLIKRLGDPNRDWPEFGHDRREAKDRIEELDARNKELTLQLLAAHGQAADALDKLAKAVEALNTIVDNGGAGAYHLARKKLAELEGK